MDSFKTIVSKFRRPFIWGVFIFLIGGFGSLVVQKYVAPYLAAKPVFRNIGFLHTNAPIVITRTEQVRVNEGVRFVDLIKQLTPNTVMIMAGRGEPGRNFEEEARGSGVIISSDGMVVTDASIFIDRRNKFFAVTSEGRIYPVTFLAKDPKSNLVLVKIEDGTLAAAGFGISAELETGQQIVLLSGTETSLPALQSTYISRAPGDETLHNIFSSESYHASFGLGVSPKAGEGIFNVKGQLIGIGTSRGEIIPVEIIKSAQESYFANKKIVRPFLGLNYAIVTSVGSQILGLPASEGLMVRGTGRTPAVLPGSPAAIASLQEGDLIFKINNETVNARQGLDIFLARSRPGDVWQVTVFRKGQEKGFSVKLGEMK